MLRYHAIQLHFVIHSYLTSIAAVLSVRHLSVNAEYVSHLVPVSLSVGGNTHLLPAHRYCPYFYEFHAEQLIVLALRFNVQRCLCAIAVNRHK